MSSHFHVSAVADAPASPVSMLERLTPGTPVDLGDGLAAVPVECFLDVADLPGVRLFRDESEVRVDEIGAGSVPVVRARSHSESMVLIVAGQLIRGGMQNRGVNADALVPAGGVVDLPVSCVEYGRWSRGPTARSAFRPSSLEPLVLRAAKHRGVSESRRNALSSRRIDPRVAHAVDQEAVWRMIGEIQVAAAFPSSSTDLLATLDSYERLREHDHAAALLPSDCRVGVLFFLDGGFIGGDAFGCVGWASEFEHSLLRSAEMTRDHVRSVQRSSGVDRGVDGAASFLPELVTAAAEELLEAAMHGEWTQRPAVGCERVEALDRTDFLATATMSPAQETLHVQFSCARPLTSSR